MKKCKQCRRDKPESEFRIRTEARYRSKKGIRQICRYLNNICKGCERENGKSYYAANREICLQKSKSYQKSIRDIQNIKQKQRRYPNGKITKKYSDYRKKYYRANKEKILNKHKLIARKSFIKQRDNLSDWYVIMIATQKRGSNAKLTKSDFKKYPELIKLYREKIKITRINRSDKFKISSTQIRLLKQKLDAKSIGVFEEHYSDSGSFVVNKKREAAWRKKMAKYLKDKEVIDIASFGTLY